MQAMKLSADRKLFLGLKVDAAMRRQIEGGNAVGRPIFKPGDPACLDLLQEGGELYIGRILEPGFAVDQVDDLKRNIRSIVGITFPDQRTGSVQLRLFAIDGAEPAADLAAAS